MPSPRGTQCFGCYPKYRDSGIEWLGEIPAHWEVRRLKEWANVWLSNVDKKSVEGEPGVRLCNYVDVYYHDRIHGAMEFMTATATPDQVRKFSLREGDVLITKDSETWTDIAVPALVTEDLADVVCGYHLALIRPKRNCVGGFVGRAIGAVGLREQYQVAANGITRFGLTADGIRNGVLPLPPLSEQRSIARFLARENAKVDALVAKQQEMISLLQEKRSALIIHAVTKGLDPNASMKESGVEWLGEIPAHWPTQRLRTLVSITTGNRDTVDRQHDGEYPFFVRSPIVERIDTWSFDGEAVLTAGDGVGVARVFHYANGRFDFHQRVYKFSSFDGILGRFFFRYFGALLRFETLRGTAKSTVDSLRLPMLQNFPVVVPPIDEQAAIVDFIDRETARIDALVAKINDAIAHLNEYRTALISAAVTGKIDVRRALEPTTTPNPTTPRPTP